MGLGLYFNFYFSMFCFLETFASVLGKSVYFVCVLRFHFNFQTEVHGGAPHWLEGEQRVVCVCTVCVGNPMLVGFGGRR